MKTPKTDNEQTTKPVTLSRRETVIGALSLIAATWNRMAAAAGEPLLGTSAREGVNRALHPAASIQMVDKGSDTFGFFTNGLPDHPTGAFPSPSNPGEILPIPVLYQIPKFPKIAANPSPLINLGGPFGILLNGVVLDPLGPFWKQKQATGWQYEVMSALGRVYLGLDFNNAHVQPSGEYHYHGRPGLVQERLEKLQARISPRRKMVLTGFASDGFPIYAPYAHANPMDSNSPLIEMTSSYALITGNRPAGAPGKIITGTADRDYRRDGSFVQDFEYGRGRGTLDECNGRFGVTPEYPQGIYYYCLTDAFPHIPRYFRGTPHSSFARPGMGDVAGVPPGLTLIFG